MNLPSNKPLSVIIVAIVITLIAQIPAITHWLENITHESPHIVFLAEGILAIIALIIATAQGSGAQK